MTTFQNIALLNDLDDEWTQWLNARALQLGSFLKGDCAELRMGGQRVASRRGSEIDLSEKATLAVGSFETIMLDRGLLESHASSHGVNGEAAQADARELMRFFALNVVFGFPFDMVASGIDDLWHAMVHRPDYEAWCYEVWGEYILHQPTSSTEKRAIREGIRVDTHRLFRSLYAVVYGENPPVEQWGPSMSGASCVAVPLPGPPREPATPVPDDDCVGPAWKIDVARISFGRALVAA